MKTLMSRILPDLSSIYKSGKVKVDKSKLPLSYNEVLDIQKKIKLGKIHTASYIGVDTHKIKYVLVIDFINLYGLMYYNRDLYRVTIIVGQNIMLSVYDVKEDTMVFETMYDPVDVISLLRKIIKTLTNSFFRPINYVEPFITNVDSNKIVTTNNHYDYVQEGELVIEGFKYDGMAYVKNIGPRAWLMVQLKKDDRYVISFFDETEFTTVEWLVSDRRLAGVAKQIEKKYRMWYDNVFGKNKYTSVNFKHKNIR